MYKSYYLGKVLCNKKLFYRRKDILFIIELSFNEGIDLQQLKHFFIVSL